MIKSILPTFLIAFIGVMFQWNYWSFGGNALGINSTIVWFGIVFLLLFHPLNTRIGFQRDWAWLLPVLLMSFSFSFYENMWLKVITIFVLPASLSLFYAYGQMNNKASFDWGSRFFKYLFTRAVLPLSSFNTSVVRSLSQSTAWLDYPVKQVILGLSILIPLGLVVSTLLSFSDSNFNDLAQAALEMLGLLVGWPLLLKVLMIAFATLVLLSIEAQWNSHGDYVETDYKVTTDSVISGIVVSGVLIIYLVYLYFQIGYLFKGMLPSEFLQAEALVKTGFWQLFFLSVFNVMLIVWLNNKTTVVTQWLLNGFIFASGLILLSACWRVGQYVYRYGLSYEKFFATYTVVFALGIFLYLLYCGLSSVKHNVSKVIWFSALWCYSIATILPIEHAILSTNLWLAKQDNNQVELSHLRALSVDIYASVRHDLGNGDRVSEFSDWTLRIEQTFCERVWYEQNLSSAINCLQSATMSQLR